MEEEWKPIEGFSDYCISNQGRVKSLKFKKERLLIPRAIGPHENNKYFDIELQKNTKRHHFKIHRLVALHFVKNLSPDSKKLVNHKDKDNFNNYFKNLEWVTSVENVCHGVNKTKTSSKYIGVSFDKEQNKWKAQINLKGLKNKNLGRYNTEEEAYEARINFEKVNNINNKYI